MRSHGQSGQSMDAGIQNSATTSSELAGKVSDKLQLRPVHFEEQVTHHRPYNTGLLRRRTDRMNSYPHEFLAHPRPLMFVAGLLPAASRDRALSTASATAGPSSRRPSVSAKNLLAAPAQDAPEAITTPITSPQAKAPSLPTSPPPADGSLDAPTSPSPRRDEVFKEEDVDPREVEFRDLVKNLRGALEPKSEKSKIWMPESERRDFRILLVDKNVRLPLRKVHPNPGASQSGSGSESARSPLSPLTPSSPTYPDGLIAPVWIRKHSELVPSVFVLFLRLFESPSSNEAPGADQAQRRDAAEREADDALVREIGERRRRLGERGIKLTVVLMASAETLGLDSRLSYLRRASALSSKASLFVLTPVPADQLPEFVQSLQEALYEAAVEYYTAHTKRVRRKRSRLPSTNLGNVVGSKGLSPGGWAVRYDWKAGWFAEIRGEYEIARRHYEDCWNELARLFASTQLLPPRTKRWAEAKVLADCVAVRICRLLLYEDDASSVLGPFFVHLKRFGDFSRGWGIGEDTFEFWSWIARQYRIFAELLELGIQSGLRIPPTPPPLLPTAASLALPPSPDFFATPTSSLNPLNTLQQPAYYFYTAAICSVQRQSRFKEALDIENEAQASEAGNTSGYVSTVPGFANEKKVDHAALIVELFTKTYSLLKEQAYPQDRVALYVAFRIAETYCQSEQYEMAMRFFDRISNSFKRDNWAPIVRQIRALWYDCAQRTGNVETAVKLSLEMIASSGDPGGGDSTLSEDEEDRQVQQDDLMGLLRTTTPATTDPIIIEMDSNAALLDVQAGFWMPSYLVDEVASFQVVCAPPPGVDISNLEFSNMTISFSDGRPDLIINSSLNASDDFADVGKVPQDRAGQSSALLKWSDGRSLTILGQIQATEEAEISITAVRLNLKEGAWDIQLVFVPRLLIGWRTSKGSINPIGDISTSASFTSPPHDVAVEVSHHPSAYIGETLPITVTINNNDTRDLDFSISAFLQPGDEADGSTISIDDQATETLLENIPLGKIAPRATISRVINLVAPEQSTKLLDITVQSTLGTGESSRSEVVEKTIAIPILPPFVLSSTMRYRQAAMTATVKGHEAFVSTTITSPGPRGLQVESLRLTPNDIEETKLLYSSLDAEGLSIPKDWDQTTSFAIFSKFNVSPARRPSLAGITVEPPAHVFIKWKRSESFTFTRMALSSSDGETVESRLPLPPLSHPTQDTFLSALIHSPPSAHLNQPFIQSLVLRNTHPSASASDLHLQVDTAEAFVWVGSRLARLPVVKAGEDVVVDMEVVPVGGTGWFTLPTVRVWAGEGEARSEVSVRSNADQVNGRGPGAIFVRP